MDHDPLTRVSTVSSVDTVSMQYATDKYCDKVKTYPKDTFIESLLIETDHKEDILSAIRNELFAKAKVVEGFPNKQLIRRRKTRAGTSIEHKLACDCYKLCIYLNGGALDELCDLFVCEKQSSCADLASSQSSVCDKSSPSQVKSVLSNEESLAALAADVLAIRNELQEQKSFNAANDIKTTTTLKDVKSLHSKDVTAIRTEMKTFVQENKKTQSELSNRLSQLELTITDYQCKVDTQNALISELTSENEKLLLKNNEYSSRLDKAENELESLRKGIDKRDQKFSVSQDKQRDIEGRIEFIERNVDYLKNPHDHAISALKGELKVHKQRLNEIKRENDETSMHCNSMKTSLTQLRSRLNNTEKTLSDIKVNKKQSVESQVTKEQFLILQAKLESITENINIPPTTTPKNVNSGIACDTADVESVPRPYAPPERRIQRTQRSPPTAPQPQSTPGGPRPRPPIVNSRIADRGRRDSAPAPRETRNTRKHTEITQHIPVRIQPQRASPGESIRRDMKTLQSKAQAFTNHGNIHSGISVYYIGNIKSSVTVETIAGHLHYHGVNIVDLHVFHSKRVGVNAAKLSIHDNQAYLLEADYFWPTGVYARYWHD